MKPLPEHTRRLSQLVNKPGGLTVNEAVQAAEQKLEGIKDRGLEEIASTIERMQGIAQQVVPTAAEGKQDLYTLSNALIGISGVFGKGGVGEIAMSLCVLIERLRSCARWDKPAVQLHIDSLRLLSDTSVGSAELLTITTALGKVVDRVRPPPASQNIN